MVVSQRIVQKLKRVSAFAVTIFSSIDAVILKDSLLGFSCVPEPVSRMRAGL